MNCKDIGDVMKNQNVTLIPSEYEMESTAQPEWFDDHQTLVNVNDGALIESIGSSINKNVRIA
ncbi:MAG: hypothetical protein CL916_00345 [Deltaproteobacteria bacterium]|nr:hypothetical protein [Deltaproteobacteria bacterium]